MGGSDEESDIDPFPYVSSPEISPEHEPVPLEHQWPLFDAAENARWIEAHQALLPQIFVYEFASSSNPLIRRLPVPGVKRGPVNYPEVLPDEEDVWGLPPIKRPTI